MAKLSFVRIIFLCTNHMNTIILKGSLIFQIWLDFEIGPEFITSNYIDLTKNISLMDNFQLIVSGSSESWTSINLRMRSHQNLTAKSPNTTSITSNVSYLTPSKTPPDIPLGDIECQSKSKSPDTVLRNHDVKLSLPCHRRRRWCRLLIGRRSNWLRSCPCCIRDLIMFIMIHNIILLFSSSLRHITIRSYSTLCRTSGSLNSNFEIISHTIVRPWHVCWHKLNLQHVDL